MPQPDTSFVWNRYADATFAGLSPLIPIPLVDWAFESIFRRRMPTRIARVRNRELPQTVIKILNRGEGTCLESCLTLPVKAIFELIKRLSRKILYFLAVKEATDKVSYYWHEAFLIDYMLLSGHLDDVETAEIARQAMHQAMRGTKTSPFLYLAGQVVSHPRRIFRSLRRARRDEEDPVIEEKKAQIVQNWDNFAEFLERLAMRYDKTFKELKDRWEAAEQNSRVAE